MTTPSTENISIHTKDLQRTYGQGELAVHALAGVDLVVPQGQFVVLLGPSGSGKTTLLNMIGGIDQPSSGSVVVDGKEVAGLSPKERTAFRRQHVAFVFQFFNLIPTLTALENVALIADLTGGDASVSEQSLKDVGLGDFMRRFPSQLSGGQQQRVAIARALAKRAPVLLCDEPTGALDRATGRDVLELIGKLNKESGCTVIMVTHDESAARFADRVIKMVDGKIVSDSQVLGENAS